MGLTGIIFPALALLILVSKAEWDTSVTAALLQRGLQHGTSSKPKPVLWIATISLAPTCSNTDYYLDQYEILLLSWQRSNNTLFSPCFVVHTLEEQELSTHIVSRLQRLRQQGARVVFHRLSFIEDLKNTPHHIDIECQAGSFLRLDAPKFFPKKKFDRYADLMLYTDLDTMWLRHIDRQEFQHLLPRTKFTVAYGSQLKMREGPINDGVVVFNLTNFREVQPLMLSHAFGLMPGKNYTRMSVMLGDSNDQGMLNHFFDETPMPEGRAFLRDEWNYKSFWGSSKKAVILHYWGVKPSQGLKCWMETRDYDNCPDIDGGLIPQSQRDLQRHALDMAEERDSNLTFLRKVLDTYDELNATIARA